MTGLSRLFCNINRSTNVVQKCRQIKPLDSLLGEAAITKQLVKSTGCIPTMLPSSPQVLALRTAPAKMEVTGEPRHLPGVKAARTHLAPSRSSVTFLRRPRPSS